MKPKAIVFIHPHFTIPGGAGKVVLELGKRLSIGTKVFVISLRIDDKYPEQYPEITFISLKGPITSSFRFWFLFFKWQKRLFIEINKLIKKYNVTLIANVFPANWLTLPYKNYHTDQKIYWYCHEPSAFIHSKKWRNAITNPLKRTIANCFAPFFSIIDKKITKNADIIFSNSKFTSQKIKETYKRKSIVLYPSVDLNKFVPVGQKNKKKYILSVGRLTKFKNFDLLIRSFYDAHLKNYQLIIIGDGEEKYNLNNLISNLNLQKKIKIISSIGDKDLIKYYQQSQLFILCSEKEPFGLVPIEAMACGTPVIANKSGGPMETILDGRTGILINMDQKTLTESIKKMINNPTLLQKYSLLAPKQIIEKFNWNKTVNILLKYI